MALRVASSKIISLGEVYSFFAISVIVEPKKAKKTRYAFLNYDSFCLLFVDYFK